MVYQKLTGSQVVELGYQGVKIRISPLSGSATNPVNTLWFRGKANKVLKPIYILIGLLFIISAFYYWKNHSQGVQIDTLDNKITITESKLQKHEANIKSLEGKLANLDQSIEQLKRTQNDIRRDIQDLKINYNALAKQLASHSGDISKLKSELKNLPNTIDSYLSYSENFIKKVKELNNAILQNNSQKANSLLAEIKKLYPKLKQERRMVLEMEEKLSGKKGDAISKLLDIIQKASVNTNPQWNLAISILKSLYDNLLIRDIDEIVNDNFSKL